METLLSLGAAWLVLLPNGGREVWNTPKPEASQLPPGAQVLYYEEDKAKDPYDYIPDISGKNAFYKPPVVPAPTEEQQKESEIIKKLTDVAEDNNLTDADFIKLLRLQYMRDQAIKLQTWQTLKQTLPVGE